jgi:hypothetical protein
LLRLTPTELLRENSAIDIRLDSARSDEDDLTSVIASDLASPEAPEIDVVGDRRKKPPGAKGALIEHGKAKCKHQPGHENTSVGAAGKPVVRIGSR